MKYNSAFFIILFSVVSMTYCFNLVEAEDGVSNSEVTIKLVEGPNYPPVEPAPLPPGDGPTIVKPSDKEAGNIHDERDDHTKEEQSVKLTGFFDRLPQMGEVQSIISLILGLIILVISSILIYNKKRGEI